MVSWDSWSIPASIKIANKRAGGFLQHRRRRLNTLEPPLCQEHYRSSGLRRRSPAPLCRYRMLEAPEKVPSSIVSEVLNTLKALEGPQPHCVRSAIEAAEEVPSSLELLSKLWRNLAPVCQKCASEKVPAALHQECQKNPASLAVLGVGGPLVTSSFSGGDSAAIGDLSPAAAAPFFESGHPRTRKG